MAPVSTFLTATFSYYGQVVYVARIVFTVEPYLAVFDPLGLATVLATAALTAPVRDPSPRLAVRLGILVDAAELGTFTRRRRATIR